MALIKKNITDVIKNDFVNHNRKVQIVLVNSNTDETTIILNDAYVRNYYEWEQFERMFEGFKNRSNLPMECFKLCARAVDYMEDGTAYNPLGINVSLLEYKG